MPDLSRTHIARLTLTNFRNYASARIDCGPRMVVLTGPNGSGKTNCLEALSLLSPGRGLRGQAFSVLARHDSDGWAISAHGRSGASDFQIGTGYSCPENGLAGRGPRTVRIDGSPAKSSGALAEILRVVWLTPAMDGLFSGPASERRRFLDRLVFTLDPGYAALAPAFDRAMRQRNRALEDYAPPPVLDALERQMAEAGAAMAFARRAAIAALSAQAKGQIAASPDCIFPWFTVSLAGEIEEKAEDRNAAQLEDWYAGRLRHNRERDRAARRTISGPHRSDLIVMHGPKQMPAGLCSTGEQKALLLGLVLAQARLAKTMNGGIAPLILLDEVAAHLDETRRAALFQELAALEAQAWMTGTDRPVFSPLEEAGAAQVFLVFNGAIRRLDDEESGPKH